MTTPPSAEWLVRANRLALIARQLSTTVHDVNNALQVISGSVELLQMSPPTGNDMVQRRITAIDGQAKRAMALLQDLSDFVRDARTEKERVELKAMAKRVLESRRYSLTARQIECALEGDGASVSANPRHVQQILLNLVVNSEEAQGSKLSISVGKADGHGEVAIVDDGTGPTATPANLGIGLEVSEWLAAQNGGTLTRESLAGRGSRALLRLPLSGG